MLLFHSLISLYHSLSSLSLSLSLFSLSYSSSLSLAGWRQAVGDAAGHGGGDGRGRGGGDDAGHRGGSGELWEGVGGNSVELPPCLALPPTVGLRTAISSDHQPARADRPPLHHSLCRAVRVTSVFAVHTRPPPVPASVHPRTEGAAALASCATASSKSHGSTHHPPCMRNTCRCSARTRERGRVSEGEREEKGRVREKRDGRGKRSMIGGFHFFYK